MALTVDEVLEQIGGYEKYQILLLFMFGYVAIALDSFPTMIVAFITAEPDWVCVQGNNSMCNFTEAITLTSNHYTADVICPERTGLMFPILHRLLRRYQNIALHI